jgi:hypothetical protein
MATITGFQAVASSGTPVQVDAFGNNAAFACIGCHAPLLAILRDHQRGSSPAKPVVCRGCGKAWWLEVNEQRRTLTVHEVQDIEDDIGSLPRVIGRPSKDAGLYKLGSMPSRLAPHNQASWNIIEAVLRAYGTAEFFDLAVAVRNHAHGDKAESGPQSFVSYCIRNGWLERA